MTDSGKRSDAYKAAGVDIDLAQNLLKRVKAKITGTRRPEVLAPIGGFGGLFRIDLAKYKNPVMVTSIDSVGTKGMVALMMDKHDTMGHDIVNHCVNDIAVQGAEPVYFMDYLGIGKLRSPLYEHVLEGLADACKAQNMALIGGETAEMPGMYADDYDLVGSITGIVEYDKIITGEKVRPGHVAIGLASNGLHTNGYSLARRVLFDMAGFGVDSCPPELEGVSVGEALLAPHTCYWPAIGPCLDDESVSLDGMAHITGGGLYDNIPRILADDVDVVIDPDVLPVPPIFTLIGSKGSIEPTEMYRVFNMGVGMVWFVPPAHVEAALSHCAKAELDAAVIGEVVSGSRKVIISGIG